MVRGHLRRKKHQAVFSNHWYSGLPSNTPAESCDTWLRVVMPGFGAHNSCVGVGKQGTEWSKARHCSANELNRILPIVLFDPHLMDPDGVGCFRYTGYSTSCCFRTRGHLDGQASYTTLHSRSSVDSPFFGTCSFPADSLLKGPEEMRPTRSCKG